MILTAFTCITFSNTTTTFAQPREVWMQNVYKDNGTIIVDFKLNIEDQLYTACNLGCIYVKNTVTGEITKVMATKLYTDETGVELYRATYTPQENENVVISIKAIKASLTGKEQQFIDDNNGHWYK